MNYKDTLKNLTKSNKRITITFLVLTLLLTLAFAFLWPRLSESTSVIQLGSIGSIGDIGKLGNTNDMIYSGIESKTIIESSTILNKVINEFYPNNGIGLQKFIDKRINIELISERGPSAELKEANSYLRITLKAETPKIAKEINQRVIDSFIDYSSKEYANRVDIINSEISKEKSDISELDSKINSLAEEIKRSSNSQNAGAEYALLNSYQSLRSDNQKTLFELEDKLLKKREFKTISLPETVPIHWGYIFSVSITFSLILSGLISFLLLKYEKR